MALLRQLGTGAAWACRQPRLVSTVSVQHSTRFLLQPQARLATRSTRAACQTRHSAAKVPFGATGGRSRHMSSLQRRFGDSMGGGSDHVLYALVGLNIAGFAALQMDATKGLMVKHAMVSAYAVFREGRVWTLVTSMFAHVNLNELVLTSLGLVFMGPAAVGMLGARRFLQLYIAGGAFSNLCHAGMPLIARAYGGHVQDSLHCGADGPLLSIFGWFVSRNPAATVSLFGVVPLPAGLCGVGYLLYEAYTLQTQGVAPGTGSRMGAFASGVMYAFFTRGSIRRW